jgi:enamine deaminase RidA (YjgF/YER057c/UK114 family)
MTPEQKLEELNITLPEKRAKGGNYISCVRTGNLLFLSGSLSYDVIGKVGDDLTIEQGYVAARDAALQGITAIKEELGELSRVRKFVKLLGFVNAAPDFISQAKVMNGASDLLVEVFGEEVGSHARTAIGAILPRGAAVEIDIVVEFE